jgi:hypothetical protein
MPFAVVLALLSTSVAQTSMVSSSLYSSVNLEDFVYLRLGQSRGGPKGERIGLLSAVDLKAPLFLKHFGFESAFEVLG